MLNPTFNRVSNNLPQKQDHFRWQRSNDKNKKKLYAIKTNILNDLKMW